MPEESTILEGFSFDQPPSEDDYAALLGRPDYPDDYFDLPEDW